MPVAAKKKNVDELPTYEDKHVDLISSGFRLKTVSESGSRYYSKPGEPGFRVSDHNPNAATEKWMFRHWVTDIRVESQSTPQLDDDAEFTLGYHDRPEISRSNLKVFKSSPREYEAMFVTETLPEFTGNAATAIGSFTHQQLLEPDLSSIAKIIPKSVLGKNGARSTNAYKEWCVENEGFVFLKQDEYDTAMRAAVAIRKEIGRMIDHPRAMREREIYWTHEVTGLKLRAKLDLIVPTSQGWHIPDIKTTANLDRFKYDISDGLWLQHAHYTAAVRAEFGEDADFWFAAVEKSGVFRTRAIGLDEDRAAMAKRRWEELLVDLARRSDASDWSETGEGEITRYGSELKF